jgi:glycosyltransferase involved in cell wall biosynthesis
LNPDVRLEPDTVAQLMAVALQHERAIVVGKLKLLWAPAFLNGLGNSVGAFHWGTDTALGHLDLGQFDDWREVPSACFAAALISRSVWEFVGPMDEGFPMYYEDSEWSYRARLLGLRIYLASKAVVYHALSGKMSPRGETNLSPRKLHFVAYGRLRFAVKILGTSLIKFLFNYFLEDFLGILLAVIRLNRPVLAAYLGAWGDFWSDLPDLRAARRVIQSHREISDAELFRLQKQLPAPLVWHGLPELTWDIINNHYLPILLSGKTRLMPEFEGSCPRLLIVSNDIIAERMAGPGIRYLEMARALHENLHVTLAVPSEVTLTVPGVQLAHYSTENPTDLREMAVSSDVILVSSFIIEKFPFLEQAARRLVVDLYDPFVLENLHYYTNEPMSIQESLNEHGVTITNHLTRIGDFFICANERQRDYWMGVLTANGRVNPHTFVQDKSLRNLIDVVGIGIPDREPQARPLVRGIHPQVPSNARIVLWGGGIWDWLDPLTLVKAWPRVLQSHPEARLIFLGTRHPNPLVPRHALAEQTERLATEVGEKDHTILFFEWLSYEDREALLAEADIGVLLHPIHIETRYSIRTRVLDYLWARLPVLITDGDVTSEWVRLYGIGRVVPPFDEAAGAEALCNLLETPKEAYAAAFGPLREQYRWRRVVEPLKRYCLGGQPAPDRGRQIADLVPNSKLPAWRWLLGRAWYILRQDGLGALLHRVWRYVQWRLSRP